MAYFFWATLYNLCDDQRSAAFAPPLPQPLVFVEQLGNPTLQLRIPLFLPESTHARCQVALISLCLFGRRPQPSDRPHFRYVLDVQTGQLVAQVAGSRYERRLNWEVEIEERHLDLLAVVQLRTDDRRNVVADLAVFCVGLNSPCTSLKQLTLEITRGSIIKNDNTACNL